MSPDERSMLTALFERIRAASGNPRDRDAEALIADGVRAMPFAPYLLAQTVLVQEQALRAANDRVVELEAQLAQQAQAPASGGSFLGGIGKSIFGNDAPRASSLPGYAPARPQNYAQPQQPAYGNSPGPWGSGQMGGGQMQAAPPASSGGGFLKGALGAAAGVAGGVLLADSIRGMMGGGHGSMFSGGGGGLFGQNANAGETVINNYYTDDSALRQQDALSDADQDQDDAQDAAYDSNDNSGSDDSTDV